ncbi:Nmad3 family putative nucleotide modification protein [Alteraurantiacibacter palmitatis]|uniref:Nucleotide modification associated domain-containing protein n=1 Tax=Alteraurantiacibacter palmitatis TaxID=2054628 RepID=A0ABV7E630_9SPHN
MKIVLSRKGFDSTAGGGPSPIVGGVPISLPIPAGRGRPGTSYAALGMADHALRASRGRVTGDDLAHHDPLFTADGRCALGQCGAAQAHLEKRGVGPGDLFLFFGLFRAEGAAPHHRIFGWMFVEDVVRVGDPAMASLAALNHPHALAAHGSNDAIWRGPGGRARTAHPELQLSASDSRPSLWRVPEWIARAGLTYHPPGPRWQGEGLLQSAARGQEFVGDAGDDAAAHAWAHRMLALMA